MYAKILDEKVIVYQQAEVNAPVTLELMAGDEIEIGEVLQKNGSEWVQVKNRQGETGYIDGKTQVEFPRSTLRDAAAKNMRHGALWCIGGMLVTAFTYTNAAPGETYIVAWGAVLFGGLQFLQGVFQYLRSL